jgi:hypothetical protein
MRQTKAEVAEIRKEMFNERCERARFFLDKNQRAIPGYFRKEVLGGSLYLVLIAIHGSRWAVIGWMLRDWLYHQKLNVKVGAQFFYWRKIRRYSEAQIERLIDEEKY